MRLAIRSALGNSLWQVVPVSDIGTEETEVEIVIVPDREPIPEPLEVPAEEPVPA